MAADRVKGITIEIGGDTTKLASALKDVNGHLKDNAAQLRDLDKLLKLDPGNTELLQQKFKVLGDSIEQAKSKLQTLKDAEKQLADNGQVGTKEWDNLQREIADTEGELRKLSDEYEEFGSVSKQQIELAAQNMQEFGGKVTDAGNRIKGAGQTISGAGKSMMPVTAGILGMGAAAIKTGADFDASMSQVKAVSGATGEDFDALRDKAIEMGSKTKFSASEAADAMNYMSMAGWKTGDMLSGIEGIMNLAAASNEDLATTSDIVTDALTAFGKSAEDSGELADVLAAASSNANTNVSMMGETFKYIAPVAGSLGFTMQDTALAASLMANSGIKASQSGTTLRSGISRLIKPTKDVETCMINLGLATAEVATELDQGKIEKAQTKVANKTIDVEKAQLKYNEAIQKYGVDSTKAQTAALNLQKAQNNLKDAESALTQAMQGKQKVIGSTNNLLTDGHGKMNSLRDVMVTLRSTMGGLTQEEQAQAAATLFGQEAMSGWLAIINASDEDFNKLCTAIDNSAGSAQSMAEIMQDNAEGDLTILKSNLESLAISISDLLTPVLRDVVGHVQEFVTWLNSLDEGTKKKIVTIGLLVAAVGPVLMVIGGVVSAIGTLVSAGGRLITLFGGIGGKIGGFIGNLTKLGGATSGASSALGGLGSAASSASAPAASAGKAIGTLSQNALGFIALGAGILLASAGLSMMAKAAIELGKAGAPAAIAMGAMVAVLALLAAGAAALGPALSAGAVGLVAFGAAVTLVGIGILAASAGLSMLADHLPTIAEYGGAAAVAIGQLALGIGAFGLASFAAAAGAAALGVGLLAFAAGAAAATLGGAAFTVAILALTVAVLAITVAVTAFAAALVLLAAGIEGVGAAVLAATTMIVDAFKVAGDAAKKALEGIKNGFTNTFNAVKSFMSGIVNWLKGLFKFEWSLPKIKLPHFSISGSFSLNPPSIPSFSVSWYRKAMEGGMILNAPTIFGAAGGKLLGGGEAGPEAVVGVSSLRSMIREAVAGAGNGGDIIIPVYFGQERVDEIIVTASQRANYRSGGR